MREESGEEDLEYSVRVWRESEFIKYVELMTVDALYTGIHRIKLRNGKSVYLVPESFYERYKPSY